MQTWVEKIVCPRTLEFRKRQHAEVGGVNTGQITYRVDEIVARFHERTLWPVGISFELWADAAQLRQPRLLLAWLWNEVANSKYTHTHTHRDTAINSTDSCWQIWYICAITTAENSRNDNHCSNCRWPKARTFKWSFAFSQSEVKVVCG